MDRLTDALEALPPERWRDPSLLPGWDRAHVVAHLARNAEALARLTGWARTGVPNPMYASPEQRNADIDASASDPPETLVAFLATSAADLETAMTALDEEAWRAPLLSASGRPLLAAEIPWLRAREVWVHLVDLDAGFGFADLPAVLAECLLDEVATGFAARRPAWSATIAATDLDRQWSIGAPNPPQISGSCAALYGWLVGRSVGADLTSAAPLPTVGPWM